MVLVVSTLALAGLAFSYFATPGWVARGLLDRQRAVAQAGYELSDARWGVGTVSYAVMSGKPSGDCSGVLTLRWQHVVGGWALERWMWTCNFHATVVANAAT